MPARRAHRYDALLLHATRRVVEVRKLHGHLVVDGQEELLALLQLALQLFTLAHSTEPHDSSDHSGSELRGKSIGCAGETGELLIDLSRP
ncbi:hypothetical protein EYF80_002955 [Liparis tanakae]|uniref:Uncharacterized protein n=1 Tax=Liparis tanakae TaxID=230148 RepID=A0A4Z2JBT6_9TELE|nr:hypothetical protein EYF80_002955 [Liparis tanakae]